VDGALVSPGSLWPCLQLLNASDYFFVASIIFEKRIKRQNRKKCFKNILNRQNCLQNESVT
jgi:hypothetical protein